MFYIAVDKNIGNKDNFPENVKRMDKAENVKELEPLNPANDDLENPGNYDVKIPEIFEETSESSSGISTSAQTPADDEIDLEIDLDTTQIIKDNYTTTPKPGIVSQNPVFVYPSSTIGYTPGFIGYSPNSIEGSFPPKYGYKPLKGGQTPVYWNILPFQYPGYMYYQFPIRNFFYLPH